MGFVLIILIGIALIVFNIKAIKKENKSFSQIYDTKLNNMDDVEVLIGEIRSEIAEAKAELQNEIEDLRDEFIDKKKEKVKKNSNENKKNVDNINNSVKINEIGEMLKQGIDVEDIAEKYGIGKGEVLLIKELYLK